MRYFFRTSGIFFTVSVILGSLFLLVSGDRIFGDDSASVKAVSSSQISEDPSKNDKKSTINSSGKENLTAETIQKYLDALAELEEKGEDTDPEKQALANQILSEQLPKNPDPVTVFTKEDIKVGSESPQGYHSYGNSVIETTRKHSVKRENELSQFQKAIETKDEAFMKNISEIADIYASLSKDMGTLTPPPALVDAHVELVNSYGTIAEGLRGMSRALEDPLAGFQGFFLYKSGYSHLGLSAKTLKAAFVENKTEFKAAEAGYAWIK